MRHPEWSASGIELEYDGAKRGRTKASRQRRLGISVGLPLSVYTKCYIMLRWIRARAWRSLLTSFVAFRSALFVPLTESSTALRMTRFEYYLSRKHRQRQKPPHVFCAAASLLPMITMIKYYLEIVPSVQYTIYEPVLSFHMGPLPILSHWAFVPL